MVDCLVGVGDGVKGMSGGGGGFVGGRLVPRETLISYKFVEQDAFVVALVEPKYFSTIIVFTVEEPTLQFL